MSTSSRDQSLHSGFRRRREAGGDDVCDVTLWGRQAEVANEYAKKGRPVYIEGRLQLDSWEDKQSGQKRSKLRVVGENLQLLGSREGTGGGRSSGGDENAPPPRPRSGGGAPASRPPAEPEDDDIPF